MIGVLIASAIVGGLAVFVFLLYDHFDRRRAARLRSLTDRLRENTDHEHKLWLIRSEQAHAHTLDAIARVKDDRESWQKGDE